MTRAFSCCSCVPCRSAPFEAGQCIRERALAFGWGWAVETFGRLADEATVLAFVCAFRPAGNKIYLLCGEDQGALDLPTTLVNGRRRRVSSVAELRTKEQDADRGRPSLPLQEPPLPSAMSLRALHVGQLLARIQGVLRTRRVGVRAVSVLFSCPQSPFRLGRWHGHDHHPQHPPFPLGRAEVPCVCRGNLQAQVVVEDLRVPARPTGSRRTRPGTRRRSGVGRASRGRRPASSRSKSGAPSRTRATTTTTTPTAAVRWALRRARGRRPRGGRSATSGIASRRRGGRRPRDGTRRPAAATRRTRGIRASTRGGRRRAAISAATNKVPKNSASGGARTRNGGHVRVVPPGGDVRGYEKDPRDPRFAAGRAPPGGYEQGPWDPRFEAGPGCDVRGYEQGAWDPRFEAARAPPGGDVRGYAQGPKKQRFAGRRNYDQADAFAHGGPQPRRCRGGRNRWDSSVVPRNDPRSPAMMQDMMQLPNQRNQRTETSRGGGH